jgi:hypothetical protein
MKHMNNKKDLFYLNTIKMLNENMNKKIDLY